ncbi:MAG: hypothetical protein NVS2B9_07050 [Myxococcales bacterium]
MAEYERRVGQLLSLVPGLSLTSDVICGFPGETDADHALNLALLRRVPFDNLFSFVYSRRPHTTADTMLERTQAAPAPEGCWAEIPRTLALARLADVQALQHERTLQSHRTRVGTEVEVLVERAESEPGSSGERFGRSRENWTTHFSGRSRVGDVVRVRVLRAGLVALAGEETSVVDPAPRAEPSQHRPRRPLTVVQA